MYPTKDEFLKEECSVKLYGKEPELKFVPVNSVWKHSSGIKYKVILIANEFSENEKYPITIVYQGLANEKIWSRPLNDWYRSMSFITMSPALSKIF